MTYVVGVDLASGDARSALAYLRVHADRVELTDVFLHATDEAILQYAAYPYVAMVGVDAPLGWPDAFVDFLQAHRSGATDPGQLMDAAGKRVLAYRRTDLNVVSETGKWPLSAATDKIGYLAMRAAGLQARMRTAGIPVDRSGRTGKVVEVYPAASLRRWNLLVPKVKGQPGEPSYRTDAASLGRAVGRLQAAARWLDIEHWGAKVRESVDCFDALLAGLTALAHLQGRTAAAPDDEIYRNEGWIALPDPNFLTDHRP